MFRYTPKEEHVVAILSNQQQGRSDVLANLAIQAARSNFAAYNAFFYHYMDTDFSSEVKLDKVPVGPDGVTFPVSYFDEQVV